MFFLSHSEDNEFYYMPGTVLGTRNTEVIETNEMILERTNRK